MQSQEPRDESLILALANVAQAANLVQKDIVLKYGVPLNANHAVPEAQDGSASGNECYGDEGAGTTISFHKVRSAAVALDKHAQKLPSGRKRCVIDLQI